MGAGDPIFGKTADELESETRAKLATLLRHALPIALAIGLLLLVWFTWRPLIIPLFMLGVFAWLVRMSPWLRARIWGGFILALINKVFHGKQTSQALPFRPLGEFEPAEIVAREGVIELPHIDWKTPAKDDQHGHARVEYARVAKLLEGMSRTRLEGRDRDERHNLVMYHAKLLDVLHEYDDNPLLSGAAPRMAALAPSDRPLGLLAASPARFLGSALSSIHLWIMGALAAFGGLQFARAQYLDSKADRALADRASLQQALRHSENERIESAKAAARDAARLAEEQQLSAKFLETEQARNRRLATDLRRIRNAASSDAGGADIGIGLRVLSEPTVSGEGANPPAAAESGSQSGVSVESGATPDVH